MTAGSKGGFGFDIGITPPRPGLNVSFKPTTHKEGRDWFQRFARAQSFSCLLSQKKNQTRIVSVSRGVREGFVLSCGPV
jgi:hypothetical protein